MSAVWADAGALGVEVLPKGSDVEGDVVDDLALALYTGADTFIVEGSSASLRRFLSDALVRLLEVEEA